MAVAVTGERKQSETWEACQGGLYLKCNAVMKSPAKAIYMLHCVCMMQVETS